MLLTVRNGEECGTMGASKVFGSNMCAQELSFPFSFKRRKTWYLLEFQHNKCKCKC